MLIQITPDRLSDLLLEPQESPDVEIKNWLDLRGDNLHKATLAKAAIALANHGGGFIILGMTEIDNQHVEADGRPATLEAYSQDHINGIVQSYAEPAFHCAVQLVARFDGKLFPVVSVPGGHGVPVRSKRGSADGKAIENETYYIRKSGPKSEKPMSGKEWDELIRRCIMNQRTDLLDQIRNLITGAVTSAPPPPQPRRLESWTQSCLARWKTLTANLPQNSPETCPYGYYYAAYELTGDLRAIPQAELPEVLSRSVTKYTGWAPFWYPTRRGIEPYLNDGAVECWLGGDTDANHAGAHDAAHSDFWRISPDGMAFLLRGYQEDDTSRFTPGTLFDVTLAVWRMGEILMHAQRLADNLIEGPSSLNFTAHYTGLAGRVLTSVSGDRAIWDDQTARQGAIELHTSVETSSIASNLPEIVHPLLTPLYALFSFSDLPSSLVVEELAKLRKGRF